MQIPNMQTVGRFIEEYCHIGPVKPAVFSMKTSLTKHSSAGSPCLYYMAFTHTQSQTTNVL